MLACIPVGLVDYIQSVICWYVLVAQSMDLNADVMQRDGMQSAYDTFSLAGDAATTPVGAQSMAQPVIATQALMPGLFAFPSLAPGSGVQPHSMGYVLPTSSQLLSDCATSTLAGGSCAVSSAMNNLLQSTVTPVVQPGMVGMTRLPASVPGSSMQPSSTTYTHSNRVSYWYLIVGAVSQCSVCSTSNCTHGFDEKLSYMFSLLDGKRILF